MTDEEMIRANYEHYAGLFPRSCSNCGRRYPTLRDYILNTHRIGAAISYDAEMGDWHAQDPLGAAALANCACGNTMALTTEGIPVATIRLMLEWVHVETERRGVSSNQLLEYLRNEVTKRALADPHQGAT